MALTLESVRLSYSALIWKAVVLTTKARPAPGLEPAVLLQKDVPNVANWRDVDTIMAAKQVPVVLWRPRSTSQRLTVLDSSSNRSI